MEHHVPKIDRLGAQITPFLDGLADNRPAAIGVQPGNRFPVAEVQDAGGDEKIVLIQGQVLKTAVPEVFAK
jgi:hypothetical protein